MNQEATTSASSWSPRAAGLWLLGIVVLALLLRVGAIVALKAWEQPNAMEHRTLAHHLVQGEGFVFRDWGYFGPSSVQSPPYPLLLAGLYQVFGVDAPAAYAAALLINALLGAATVWMVYRLALSFGATPPVALVAAALLAIWPTQVYAVTHAQAIALITFAVVAVIDLFHRALDSGRLGPWIAMSLIGCLGMLTEPVLLPPMALTGLLVFVWPSKLTARHRLRNAAILLLAAMVILGPWSVRNRVVHERWIPVKSTFWVNMWKANNDHATGTDRLPISDEQLAALQSAPLWQRDQIARDGQFDAHRQYDLLTQEQVARLRGRTEAQREDIFREFATAWIGQNRGRYVELCFIRLGKTLWIDWDNPKSHNLVYLASRVTLLTLAGVGLVLALWRRWRLGYAAVVVGCALALYTLTITAARFSLPFEPLALCLAALTIASILSWLRSRFSRARN